MLAYDAGRLQAAVEEIPVSDARLRGVWGDRLVRIVLTARGRALRGRHRILLGYASPRGSERPREAQ